MSQMRETFAAARAEGRAALIGYLPAGFPTLADSVSLIEAMVENGVDIVEVGLPYSDPLMDGPVIQEAAERALAAGCTTPHVLDVVQAVSRLGAPVTVMSYWNPIEQYGPQRFAQELSAAGGAAVITPDIIPEEAADWTSVTDEASIERIFLAAPSSTDERLESVVRSCSGFVYAASLMGVTGTRTSVSGAAEKLVTRLRPLTHLPIAVGLGVSTPAQARQVAGYADGVIVGSAFVRRVLEGRNPREAARGVSQLAADLAEGVRAAG